MVFLYHLITNTRYLIVTIERVILVERDSDGKGYKMCQLLETECVCLSRERESTNNYKGNVIFTRT